jgi:hypothetical protein
VKIQLQWVLTSGKNKQSNLLVYKAAIRLVSQKGKKGDQDEDSYYGMWRHLD